MCGACVVLTCHPVQSVDIDFMCLQPWVGNAGTVERVIKLHPPETGDSAVFAVVLRIQVVYRLFGVQYRRAIGANCPVPADYAWCNLLELCRPLHGSSAEILVTVLARKFER